VPDTHFYVNRPLEKYVPGLEGLEDALKRLEHVSEVRANPTTRVVAVTFTGGRAEQKEIERVIEETGYEGYPGAPSGPTSRGNEAGR